MAIEPYPQFSAPAAKLWTCVSDSDKRELRSNVWRCKCHHADTIAIISVQSVPGICW